MLQKPLFLKQPLTQYKKSMHIASITCVVHCLATPLLMVFSPFMGSLLQNTWIELSLLIMSILIGCYIIITGFCTHKKTHASILFIIGAILWAMHTLFHCHTCQNIPGTQLYFFTGTTLVLGAYYLNHHYLKDCPSKCCNPQ